MIGFKARDKETGRISAWPCILGASIQFLLGWALLGGAGEPVRAEAEGFAKPAAQAHFYPPSPAPPRIQFLRTFSSSLEFQIRQQAKRPKRSRLNRFLFGERKPSQPEYYYPDKPFGVAIRNGKIFLVDLRGDMYVIYDLVKWEYTQIVPSGAGALMQPTNLTLDGNGTKYICDAEAHRITAFGPDDRYLRSYLLSAGRRPTDVAITEDYLYVADILGNEILILDKESGEQVGQIPGSKESHAPGMPSHLFIHDGILFVSEAQHFHISHYTLDGDYIGSFGEVGDWPGAFARPKGVVVDREGRQYVLDAAFENVQVFDRDNRLLMVFGGTGESPDRLSLPVDIAIDYDNIGYFREYAHADFEVEYIILVSNQFGERKVAVFGFGRLAGLHYPEDTDE